MKLQQMLRLSLPLLVVLLVGCGFSTSSEPDIKPDSEQTFRPLPSATPIPVSFDNPNAASPEQTEEPADNQAAEAADPTAVASNDESTGEETSPQTTEEPTDESEGPLETAEPGDDQPAETAPVTIRVTLENNTPGAEVPVDLEVELFVTELSIEGDQVRPVSVSEAQSQVSEDAQVTFEDVLVPTSGATIFVATDYQGATYGAEEFIASPQTEPVDITLPVYEATNDASVVRFSQVWYVLQSVTDGVAEMETWYTVDNTGNRTYVGSEDSEATVRLELPANAQDIEVLENLRTERFQIDTAGDTPVVVDTQAVSPVTSSSPVRIRYQLPVEDAFQLTLMPDYPVEQLNVYTPVSLSPQWEVPEFGFTGITTIDQATTMLVFRHEGAIEASEVTTFTLQPSEEIRGEDADSLVQVVVNLTNETAGAEVPTNLELTVRSLVTPQTATGTPESIYEQSRLPQNGQYNFSDVPLREDGFLEISTNYQGVRYLLNVLQSEVSSPVVEETITLFEATTDPSVVRLERVWYISDAVIAEQWSQYLNWYFFTNNSDRVYIGDNETPGVIRITLPTGAQSPEFQFGGQGLSIDTSTTPPTVVDSRVLFPGETQQILVDYLIRYPGEVTVAQQIGYPADEIIAYTLEARRLNFEGQNFEPTGPSEIRGMGSYESYTWQDVPTDATVSFTISDSPDTPQGNTASGAPTTSTGQQTTAQENEEDFLQANTDLILGIGILLIVFGAIYLFYDLQKTRLTLATQSATTVATSMSRDDLIQAIADLDDAYEQGEIEEDDYREQRSLLKSRLRRVMEND